MSEELSNFERLIMSSIRFKHNFDYEEADFIVRRYLKVIRLLDEKHNSADTESDLYVHACQTGVDPDEWINHILKTREKYSK